MAGGKILQLDLVGTYVLAPTISEWRENLKKDEIYSLPKTRGELPPRIIGVCLMVLTSRLLKSVVETARRTGTKVIVMREGQIEHLSPEELPELSLPPWSAEPRGPEDSK